MIRKADIQMDVSPVLAILRQKIGLNPESIGTASVEKAVRERIEKSGAASVEDYVKNVSLSAAELGDLVESVLVRETSFFRNRTPFIALHSYLQQFVLNTERTRPLRILCLPCSTGEEAYSIAMVLLDLKLSSDQFSILAVDISAPVLEIAQAGRYSEYSFRGGDMAFRQKYFAVQPDGTYLINKEIRDAVRFEQANILDDDIQFGQEPYDVIFCRNLLIYFDPAAKNKAINALARHMSEKGVLFVGHAEGANISNFGLASLHYPMSFAFARQEHATAINDVLDLDSPAKRSSAQPAEAHRHTIKAGVLGDAWRTTAVASQPLANAKKESDSIVSPAANDIAAKISTIRRLADAGSFNEAVALCEKLLLEGVVSAEVYFLLGQIAVSTEDNLMAEEYLRKAIYLDADFFDALMFLSLLYDRMGNPGKAATFRERAQRVKLRNA